MSLRVRKFPAMVWRGQQLVWDSRQPVGPGPELHFLPSGTDARASEIREALRARPAARQTVGLPGSGADLEVEHPGRFLGHCAAEASGFASR